MSASESRPAVSLAPHCVHVVGIGRTGAVYVEALLRTGEVEDQLVQSGATFAALVIDIGDEDMAIAMDYAAAFSKRLESRGIPAERFQFQAVQLPAPTELAIADLKKSLAFLKEKAHGVGFAQLGSVQPAATMSIDPEGHVTPAIAKSVYASAYYAGDRPLDTALSAFANHVTAAKLPSVVTVCFSIAGGLGGGMAIDLARHLSNGKLGRKVPVVGVGQLPSTGDSEATQTSATLYANLNNLDYMLDGEKNAAVVAAWGETYRGPFTGGFFVVNPEQSWQRLTAYTTTGEPPIRLRFKQTVTNRFVADSFMRQLVLPSGYEMIKTLPQAGAGSTTSRPWTLFDVAKLTHPGVQVLPGEARSKWDAVVAQWIDFTPKYSGLVAGFKADTAQAFIYGSRNMGVEMMESAFKTMITNTYLSGGNATLSMSTTEFFDTLTAYANVVLPGVALSDLTACAVSEKTYDALPPSGQLNVHAWVVDTGTKLPPASAPLEPMAGTAIWGASCWSTVAKPATTARKAS